MSTSESRGVVKRRTSARAHRGTKRRFSRPASRLAERWTTIDGVDVFYRESPSPPDAPVMLHLHGFGLSGRYLLPTAEALADEFHTLVPDLPGFGRSGNAIEPLTVTELAHAAAAFLDTQGIQKVTLIGNSMGCPVICEFAYEYPDRLERAILVSPAGGIHNQPLLRAVRQLSRDGLREPVRLLRVAVPDYVRFGVPSTFRMFRALTQYPASGPAPRFGQANAGGCREPRPIASGSGAHRRSGQSGRAPRPLRRDRWGGSRHQFLPPRRAGQRHSTVHGRQADRR